MISAGGCVHYSIGKPNTAYSGGNMVGNIFDQIKKINDYGQEYWSARDLYKLLGYTEYGKFLPAIERAKAACKNSGQEIDLHFAQVSEPQKSSNQYGEIQ
jgi:DNA-damage-inducible protein D